MKAPRSEPDLLALRKMAEELAKSRKERTTSGHLLAAIASEESPAAALLLERKLGADILLKAARATTDEEPDPISRAIQRARELAARLGTTGPGPMHLLLALIHDRKSGAHRALAQCGVDVARLRASAMQLALGRIGPRRVTSEQSAEKRPQVGVAISLLPPPKNVPSAPPPPASLIPSRSPRALTLDKPSAPVPEKQAPLSDRPGMATRSLASEDKKRLMHRAASSRASRFSLD